MQRLLYIGCVYTGSIVGLAVWLFVGLAVGSIASIKGVVDCAGPLRAVFIVPIV